MPQRTYQRAPRTVIGRGSTIQVIDRLARVLEVFAGSGRQMKVRELAATLHLRRSTAHRYLASLSSAGFLRAEGEGAYALGPLLIQLGSAAVGGVQIVDLAESYLSQLAEEAQETVVLSLWAGNCPVVVRVREPQAKLVQLHIRLGATLPLDSAQGHLYLAFLPDRVRVQQLLAQFPEGQRRELERGMAQARNNSVFVNSRVAEGIRAVAAPVFDHELIAGTIAFVGTLSSVPADHDSGLAQALKSTAQRLSRDLGRGREPAQGMARSIPA
ncbi:MAG: IclR family transcriptional regulator [Candidatus Angelobacter sp.]